mgnify:CR=1 FL=1
MKTASVRDVYDWLNQIAPFDTAESYDNAGLLLGSMSAPAERILVALDATPAVIDEAIAHQAQLIVTHHPLMFHAAKNLLEDDYEGHVIRTLIQHNISLIAALLCGRVVAGLMQALIFSKGAYSMTAWVSGYVVTSWPGTLIQLVLLPSVVFALMKAHLIPERYPKN